MKLKIKIGIAILSILLIIITGLLIIRFVAFSPENMKKKAEKILYMSVVDSCSVGSIEIKALRGIIIHDIKVVKSITEEKTLRVSIPELFINYKLFKIVSQKKAFEDAIKGRFSKLIMRELNPEMGYLPFLYSQITGSDTTLLSCTKSIEFENITIEIDSLGEIYKEIKDVSGEIRIKRAKTGSTRLKIKLFIDEIMLNGIRISDLKTNIKIKGHYCEIKKLTCEPLGGKFKGEFNLNLRDNQINSGEFEIINFDLEKLYLAKSEEEGTILGKCNCFWAFDSCTFRLDSLKGKGKLQANGFSAKDLPIQKKIASLTSLKSLKHIQFEKVEGVFVAEENRIKCDTIEAYGKPLSLNASGYFEPANQYYSFELRGIFERHYKDSVSEIIWEALFPEKRGRRSFRCTISGTPENAGVSFDKKQAKRAINSVIKSISKDIKSFLNLN